MPGVESVGGKRGVRGVLRTKIQARNFFMDRFTSVQAWSVFKQEKQVWDSWAKVKTYTRIDKKSLYEIHEQKVINDTRIDKNWVLFFICPCCPLRDLTSFDRVCEIFTSCKELQKFPSSLVLAFLLLYTDPFWSSSCSLPVIWWFHLCGVDSSQASIPRTS